MMTRRMATAMLLLVQLSATTVLAATIFEEIVPTNCVNPVMQLAGFCVLQNGCAQTCFNQRIHDNQPPPTPSPVDAASLLSLERDPLMNFYIPVDAVECDEFEEPICAATQCCSACKDELNELYRCIVLEGDHHYIDPLAIRCPLTCLPTEITNLQPERPSVPPVIIPEFLPSESPTPMEEPLEPESNPTEVEIDDVDTESNMTETDTSNSTEVDDIDDMDTESNVTETDTSNSTEVDDIDDMDTESNVTETDTSNSTEVDGIDDVDTESNVTETDTGTLLGSRPPMVLPETDDTDTDTDTPLLGSRPPIVMPDMETDSNMTDNMHDAMPEEEDIFDVVADGDLETVIVEEIIWTDGCNLDAVPSDFSDPVPALCTAEFEEAICCTMGNIFECSEMIGMFPELLELPSRNEIQECQDVEYPYCMVANSCLSCIEQYDALFGCIVEKDPSIPLVEPFTFTLNFLDSCDLTVCFGDDLEMSQPPPAEQADAAVLATLAAAP